MIFYKIKKLFNKKDAFQEPNVIDRFLEKTALRLIPHRVKPNHITVFRYITIPFVIFFILFDFHVIALIIFLFAVFSDALDGAIARTRNSITEWGKIHDPIADKILIGVVGSYLVVKYLSVIIIASIIIIELIIIISALYRRNRQKKLIGALLPGKIKMALQSLALILLLFYSLTTFPLLLNFAEALLYLAIFFALISIFIYKSL